MQLSDVLDEIYAARVKTYRNPTKIQMSEASLRSIVAGTIPDDGPLVGPMSLYGIPLELDDELGDRIEVEVSQPFKLGLSDHQTGDENR